MPLMMKGTPFLVSPSVPGVGLEPTRLVANGVSKFYKAAESKFVVPHSSLLCLTVTALCFVLGGCGLSRVSYSDTSASGVYVPIDVDDAIVQIDSLLTDDQIEELRALESEDQFLGRTHLSLGMWLRNNWDLWRGSRLSAYFNERRVYHPEAISGVLLVSYYRHLQGESIRLDEQLAASAETASE